MGHTLTMVSVRLIHIRSEDRILIQLRLVASAIIVGSIYGYLKKPMKSMYATGKPN